MSDHSNSHNELAHQLDDRPGVIKSTLAALQHVLVSFFSIITPVLIIGFTLGLDEHIPYLISMALIVSGVATLIQASRPLGIGCGLLSIQGTSLVFLSAILAVGLIAKNKGASPEEILSLIFTLSFIGAFVEIFLSQVLGRLKRIVTPLVSGIVITLMGISLLKIGMSDLAGGNLGDNHVIADFANPKNLILGAIVFFITMITSNKWLKAASVLLAFIIGYLIAIPMEKVDLSQIETLVETAPTALANVTIPLPFKYGFNVEDIDIGSFLLIAVMYVVVSIETMGNITATSVITGTGAKGSDYIKRVRGGILADGINSIIAAVFNAFPNAPLSQNIGLIQLSGVASRYIAYFVAFFLILLGLFPFIGHILQTIPRPIIGGASIILFASVAAIGIKILKRVPMTHRNQLIMAISFSLGFGGLLLPEALAQLPETVKNLFSNPVGIGGLAAIVLNIITPKPSSK